MTESLNLQKDCLLTSSHLKAVLAGNTSVYSDWAPDYETDLTAVGFPGPVNLAAVLAKVFAQPNFRFRDNKKIRILDVGAGTGWTAEAVLAAVPNSGRLEITGADISPEMLKKSAAKNIYEKLVQVDLNSDVVSGVFDIVVSTGAFALGHVKLDGIQRIIENNIGDNGIIMLSCKNTFFEQVYADKLKEAGWIVEQGKIVIYGAGDTAELLTISKRPIGHVA
jgi:predicted TPR repeat methyltransferase